MAQVYSNDLRRKFLEAHEQGLGTLEELAEEFGVSLGFAKKISAALRRNGTNGADRATAWTDRPGDAIGTGTIAGEAAATAGSHLSRVAAVAAGTAANLLELAARVGDFRADEVAT
jgi:hypothetical protein